MSDRPTVFCKDCKLLRKGWLEPSSMAKCGHPSAIIFDGNYLVTAKAGNRQYASSMRYQHNACGPEAKLWEPRK